jgi:hypothetical protein
VVSFGDLLICCTCWGIASFLQPHDAVLSYKSQERVQYSYKKLSIVERVIVSLGLTFLESKRRSSRGESSGREVH